MASLKAKLAEQESEASSAGNFLYFSSISPLFLIFFSSLSLLFFLFFSSFSHLFLLSFFYIYPLFLIYFSSISPLFLLYFFFLSPLFLLYLSSISPLFLPSLFPSLTNVTHNNTYLPSAMTDHDTLCPREIVLKPISGKDATKQNRIYPSLTLRQQKM